MGGLQNRKKGCAVFIFTIEALVPWLHSVRFDCLNRVNEAPLSRLVASLRFPSW